MLTPLAAAFRYPYRRVTTAWGHQGVALPENGPRFHRMISARSLGSAAALVLVPAPALAPALAPAPAPALVLPQDVGRPRRWPVAWEQP